MAPLIDRRYMNFKIIPNTHRTKMSYTQNSKTISRKHSKARKCDVLLFKIRNGVLV